jgi:hypothetical protein
MTEERRRMSVKIGKYFEVSLRDRYVSIPFIGAGHFGSFGLVWVGCKEIKKIERAQEARRRQAIAELEATR